MEDDSAIHEYVLAVDRESIASEIVFSAVSSGKALRIEEVSATADLVNEETRSRAIIVGDRERQFLYLQQLESTRRFTISVTDDDISPLRNRQHESTAPSGNQHHHVDEDNQRPRAGADDQHGIAAMYGEEVFEEQRRFLEHQYSPLRNPEQFSTHFIVLQQQHSATADASSAPRERDVSPPRGGASVGLVPADLPHQPGRHVGGIDMSYLDFLSKRHGLHGGLPAHPPPAAAPAAGRQGKATSARSSATVLPEGIRKAILFAEGASRGALELDWREGWGTLAELAKQQQWLIYDWSLSGPVRQTKKDLKGPDVDYRHIPPALRPPQRPSPRSSRPPTAGSLSSNAVVPSSSPRVAMRRPPSAAVMVANLKSAVPSSFMHRVAPPAT